MKIDEINPPRQFHVGKVCEIVIDHCADVYLNENEQITFKTDKTEYDVVKKEWGYYASPSTNKRLKNHNLRTALAKNMKTGLYFILMVEEGKQDSFNQYMEQESMKVLYWLDGDNVFGDV